MGAVETLICWENLDIVRYKLKNAAGLETVLNLKPDQEKNKEHFTDNESGADLEIVETMALLEWLANNYKVSNSTSICYQCFLFRISVQL